MKSTGAGLWLAIATLLIVGLAPVQAQTSDATTSTTTATVSTPPDAVTTKKHRFRKQKPKRAKTTRRHRVSGTGLSGGVSKKKRWHRGKTYKPYSSGQQKRLSKLDAALSNPKQYKKMPELSSPAGVNSTNGAPGL